MIYVSQATFDALRNLAEQGCERAAALLLFVMAYPAVGPGAERPGTGGIGFQIAENRASAPSFVRPINALTTDLLAS